MLTIPENRVTRKNFHKISFERETCSITWLFYLVPLALISLSLLFLFSTNGRPKAIQDYNVKVVYWNDVIYPQLLSSKFTVQNELKIYSFITASNENGENWPVRDECNQWRDPEEGCVSANDLFFTTEVELQNVMHLHFKLNEDVDLGTIQVVGRKVISYSPSDLTCESLEECSVVCQTIHGNWDAELSVCTIIQSLKNLCYTIYKVGTVFLLSPSLNGCYFDGTNWSTTEYDTTPLTQFTLQLRYIEDPYLLAAKYTENCSVQSDTQQFCFGNFTRYSLTISILFFLLFLFSIIFEITVIIIFSSFYKNPKYIPLYPCCHKQCIIKRHCCCSV